MLYIIGLGLDEPGITQEGVDAIKKCPKVYLEGYTVDFPYDVEKVMNRLTSGKKEILVLGRKDVESNKLIKEAKGRKVALLVYGSPLFATTHMSLIQDAKEQGVTTKIIYSASIFDALGETGLQLYKFGKITSMPAWKAKYKPDSFMDVVKDNQSIKAHSLILCDIGLKLEDALEQLQVAATNKKINLDKIVVCSNMGTRQSEIFYDSIENLKEEHIHNPFCIIIPSDLQFMEKEILSKV